MGDYPRFFGSLAFKSRNREFPVPSFLFPSTKGPWHLRVQWPVAAASLRIPYIQAIELPLSHKQRGLRYDSSTVLDTFVTKSRSFFRRKIDSIIAWWSLLRSCSHLGTLWRPLFMESLLRKLTIAFYEVLNANLYLLLFGRRINFFLLNYINRCKEINRHLTVKL